MVRLDGFRRGFDRAARRAFDVMIAVTGLLIAVPVMAIIALAIVIDTPGPVFFSQTRLGRGGRHFRLRKFRKFDHRPGAGGRHVTLKDDPRMTRVGRVLERTKLDELPQLWNILVGEMSVVGPRPESLAFADCFVSPYDRVLDHVPGLLGPSQAIFRNEGALYPAGGDPHEFYRKVLFPLKARIDLAYFAHRSLRSDLKWMLRGVLAVCGVAVSSNVDHRDAAEMKLSLGQSAEMAFASAAERN